jgi:hypothetical protein
MSWLDSELDRLLAPAYLGELDQRSLEDIRAMRADCQITETAVSFLRRMAQGRLDVVHAALDAQASRGGADSDPTAVDASALIDKLPDILGSGPQRPPGPGRLPSHMAPDLEQDDLTAEVDAALDVEKLATLTSMSTEELRAAADRLTAIEARVSGQRRALHDRIDRLQAEIVSRYKTGRASVDGLLA